MICQNSEPSGISTSTPWHFHVEPILSHMFFERNTDDVEKKTVGSPGKSIFQSTCESLGGSTRFRQVNLLVDHILHGNSAKHLILFKSECFMWESSSIGNVSISSGLVALAGFTGSWIQNWKQVGCQTSV